MDLHWPCELGPFLKAHVPVTNLYKGMAVDDIYYLYATGNFIDHFHRVEQHETGQGQLHIKEKCMIVVE